MLRKLSKKVSMVSDGLFQRQSPTGRTKSGRAKSGRFGHLALEHLEQRLVLDSTVVFNEVMYNPAGETDSTQEWVELYNQMAVNMDLNGWSLEGGVDFDFPEGTTVPGHGFLVVAAQPSAVTGVPYGVEVLGPFDGQLSNGGEELRLVNIDGRKMNILDYGDSGDWPVGADGSGASLAKIYPDTASEPAENWTFSAQRGGTPGAVNFVASGDPGSVSETLLSSGAPAYALVPPNNDLGLTWKDPGFVVNATWLSGNTGVGYEGSSGYDPLLGLDLDDPPGGQTPQPMRYVHETVYIRVPFQLEADQLQYDALLLKMKYDDGFVAYLNGVEVEAANAPGRDGSGGTLAWDSGATGGHSDSAAQVFEDFDVTSHLDLLVEGENVLAIHGLNDGASSSDLVMLPELAGVKHLPDPEGLTSVLFNEVASATDADFWVEITNPGQEVVDLQGFVLSVTGVNGGVYLFPDHTISPGELLEVQLPFHPDNGEKLFLSTPGQSQLVDARIVTNRLRGRSEEHEGRWLYPSSATPGTANTFDFHDEIVINEIMYHAFPTLSVTDENFDEIQPYTESDEEWIELYNRGTTTVDLTGWKLEDGISYDFEPDTTLAPGEYLVVAKDAFSLHAKYQAFSEYPEFEIVGDYSGSLNNRDDLITLIDENENPADEVHYYERGPWPAYADGGGSTLELRDPNADNSAAEAWAASDERDKSSWDTYTYSKVSNQVLVSQRYNELILGLLDSGEVLLDDIHVIKYPDGSRTEMMQNGGFENDPEGSSPATWRIIGNHHGKVVVDPDDPDNKVLHLTADDAQWFVHDHAETTFVNNTANGEGSPYEISFRAKWLAGNSQVNTRLYFTRAGNTANVEVPRQHGTPGMQNSMLETNVGPTYSGFSHSPILPSSGQSVTVTVAAEDPDGVQSMFLKYGTGGSFTTVEMTLDGDGNYRAAIPGHSSNTVVQFYVEGKDGQEVTSTFPAAGPDSRALYQVATESPRSIDTTRVVMLSSDYSALFGGNTVRMSNQYLPCTLIATSVHGQEAFYDSRVRQTGSRFTRPSGLKVDVGPHQPYRGVHDSIRLDWTHAEEILMKHMITAAGGTVSHYDDIGYLVSGRHTGRVLLQLARYSEVFFDEHFENGGDGTLYELDDITYPTNPSPSPEGLKTSTGYVSSDIYYRGDYDKEKYRGYFLIKNNRARDDFQRVMEMSEAINLSGQAMQDATNAVMDVDMWMRHYATQSFLGNWDTYGFRRHKNLRIYVRPEDNMVIPLPWDQDLGNYTDSLIYNGSKLSTLRDRPANLRLFWGHMWDLVNRSFNREYIEPWANHYGSLFSTGFSGDVGLIGNRVNTARTQAIQAIPQVPFEITTNGGNSFETPAHSVTLEGKGWINVREIRLAGSDEPLEVTWTGRNTWEAKVLLQPGENVLTLLPFNYQGSVDAQGNPVDYQGNQMGSDTITVTSTMPVPPIVEWLRITELNYNPSDPTPEEQALGFTDQDDFEFVEVQNTGDEPIDLAGSEFTRGIDFRFVGELSGAPVLITEAKTGADSVEIQNVSDTAVNTAGWFVVANNGRKVSALGNIPDVNAFHETVWELPNSMPSEKILYRHDQQPAPGETDPQYWGENIIWSTRGNGWLMLVDAEGNVADFVVWGYSTEEIASLQIEVVRGQDTFQLSPAGAWSGEAVPNGDDVENSGTSLNSVQRIGFSDHDNVSDWAFIDPDSLDEKNEALLTPFNRGSFELGPGEYAYVAGNPAAFKARYGAEHDVAGPYDMNLSNGGERITLCDIFGSVIADFTYGDSDDSGWPNRADGNGSSLELIDSTAVPLDPAERTLFLEASENWRSSSEYGGSPGVAGEGPRNDVLINEVLSHTDLPAVDSIELYNTTGEPINIGGWYLSDSNSPYKKFRIPNTTIDAYGYVMFDEYDFNPTGIDLNPDNDDPNDFGLNGAHGDDAWLLEADAQGNLIRFVDHEEFPAMANGESFGRWPDGSGELYPMTRPTLNPAGENSGPRVGPVIISEVQYNPVGGIGAVNLEFIEIYNTTASTEDLTNWRIRKSVDFDFPAGTLLAPQAALVVVRFDTRATTLLDDFCEHYGISPDTVQIVGGYTGQMAFDFDPDGGTPGVIQLQRPDAPPLDEPGYIPRLLEDEVRYSNVAPWPVDADGTGASLNRVFDNDWGNDPESWTAASASPGTVLMASESQVIGYHIFYHNAAGYASDDQAIAPDKTALLPGETAGFANYTSYARGINGVMVDIFGLPDGVTLDGNDFEFHVGNSDDPDTWAQAPLPASITVRPDDGYGGSDRVTITFNDGAIKNQWLRVTVLDTTDTGLPEPDVFYFGNAVGETGNSAGNAKVNAADVLLTRNNPRGSLNPAPIDFRYDFNRDRRVNATDMLLARENQTHLFNALRLISVPDFSGKSNDEALMTNDESGTALSLLYELDEFTTTARRGEKGDTVEEAVDALLAGDLE